MTPIALCDKCVRVCDQAHKVGKLPSPFQEYFSCLSRTLRLQSPHTIALQGMPRRAPTQRSCERAMVSIESLLCCSTTVMSYKMVLSTACIVYAGYRCHVAHIFQR
jgi:hypothetical protein